MATPTPYEALVESATRLTGIDALRDLEGVDAFTIAGIVESNRPALAAARCALGLHCSVPPYKECDFAPIAQLRNLGYAFRAEAALAVSKGDFHAAALIGIDLLELANAARRGGLLIELLVGMAFSSIALELLRKERTRFRGETRCLLIAELQRLDAEQEPFEEIMEREAAWQVANDCEEVPGEPLTVELEDPEECGVSKEDQRTVHNLIQQAINAPEPDRRALELQLDQRTLSSLRLLAIDLALREARDSSGSFPNDLTALSPGLLTTVPVDPFTGKAFIYRAAPGDSFLLYSTGPKLHDGGGKFGPWPSVCAGGADLCLDADDYAPACSLVSPPRGLTDRIAAAIRSCMETWRRAWPWSRNSK